MELALLAKEEEEGFLGWRILLTRRGQFLYNVWACRACTFYPLPSSLVPLLCLAIPRPARPFPNLISNLAIMYESN